MGLGWNGAGASGLNVVGRVVVANYREAVG